MPAAASKRQPEEPPAPHPAPRIYTVEATGLLIVSALLLILTVIRYWHSIYWGWR